MCSIILYVIMNKYRIKCWGSSYNTLSNSAVQLHKRLTIALLLSLYFDHVRLLLRLSMNSDVCVCSKCSEVNRATAYHENPLNLIGSTLCYHLQSGCPLTRDMAHHRLELFL